MATLLELMRAAKANPVPAVPSARLAHDPFVFWSGIDFPGEFRALLEHGVAFGIATVPPGPGRKGMSLGDFDQLLRLVRATRNDPTPIFVDSGAYRETSGTTYTEADWDHVLDRYRRVAEAAGPGSRGAPPRVFVVAPDVVGNFAGTEARLGGRGPALQALVAAGAHVLLPLQPGPGTLVEREARLRAAAGVGPAGSVSSRDPHGREAVHPAFPWTKKAKPHPPLESASGDSVAAFLRARRPDRVHFLGVGEKSTAASAPQGTWVQIVATVVRASPQTQLQADANKLGAMTAQGRPYTRAGALVDAGVVALRPFDDVDAEIMDGDGDRLGGSTENVVTLAHWTTPEERRRIGVAGGLDEDEIVLFARDPDLFFEDKGADDETWDDRSAWLHAAIDAAWVDRAERFASTGLRADPDLVGDRRRHLQVRHVLREPPEAETLLAWVERDSGRSVKDPAVTAWLRDAGVTVRGQGTHRELRLLSGPPSPENARRRLSDALDADEGVGALHAIRDPVRAAAFRASEKKRVAREVLETREKAALDKAQKKGMDLVFAFGSNLRRAQLVDRVPGAVPVARATLSRYRLAFAGNSRMNDAEYGVVTGQALGGPVATVVPTDWGEGGPVYGALYALPRGGLEQLDRYEGAPTVYRREKRDVLAGNRMVSAWVYVHTAPEGGQPTAAYRDAIEAGRAEWGIAADPIVAVSAGRPVAQAHPGPARAPAPGTTLLDHLAKLRGAR